MLPGALTILGGLVIWKVISLFFFPVFFPGPEVVLKRMAEIYRGRIIDAGLWAWSRHPNYFFEWLGWLAYPLIAIQFDWPPGWLALGAPAIMYWLLVHVSGVPPLEQQLQRSRPEAFSIYRTKVSAFWPRRPRR